MRIIQTSWTAGRDPLKHSFGWLRPEHNLMAWMLSSLSIREHNNEPVLYTDEQGKHVLIDFHGKTGLREVQFLSASLYKEGLVLARHVL